MDDLPAIIGFVIFLISAVVFQLNEDKQFSEEKKELERLMKLGKKRR